MDKARVIRPAAYTLVVQNCSLLLCRLCPPEPETGKWTLPGGGLDFGEKPEDAAIRETHEETGLNVKLIQLIEVDSCVYEFPDRDMHALRFIYLAEAIGGDLRHEQQGSTDRACFMPIEATLRGAPHPEYGNVPLVKLARLGLALVSS